MIDEIDEAIDWRGEAVACAPCAHHELLAEGGCRLRHACVHDRYARRIDRFFNWNRDLANSYLKHPHFEVRAIAAKSADVFRLPPLLDDDEETVRWNAVIRLPYRYLMRLRTDPHREVRIRVATRLNACDLSDMIDDADYYVRLVVARRIGTGHLLQMIDDPETQVRIVVAQRIDDLVLVEMHTTDGVAAALVDEAIARRMRDALDTALGRGFARPKPANGDA